MPTLDDYDVQGLALYGDAVARRQWVLANAVVEGRAFHGLSMAGLFLRDPDTGDSLSKNAETYILDTIRELGAAHPERQPCQGCGCMPRTADHVLIDDEWLCPECATVAGIEHAGLYGTERKHRGRSNGST